MNDAVNMELLVQTEPWRNGQGRPRSSIDPIWADDTLTICEATTDELMWESNSNGWWWCTKCGHCSNMHNTTHYIVESPEVYHQKSLTQYYKRRTTQGFPKQEAHDQALHIAAVALRVAASKRPEEFAKLVDDIIALAN